MKKVPFVFLLILFSGLVYSAQPIRKPFVELFIEGRRILDGKEYSVDKGDRFTLLAQIKGGRGDFVQYPDTYADLGENVEIISRGYNKLIYKKDGKEYKWERTNENIEFESDNRIQIDLTSDLINKHEALITIPVKQVEKSYIKATITTTWEFYDGNVIKQELDTATAVILLSIKGNENEWFASPNVKASGTKNPVIEQQLTAVQQSYEKIEALFTQFDFAAVQTEIRNLQGTMHQLDTELQKINTENPAKHSDIFFIGLPSDQTVNDINNFKTLGDAWNDLESLIQEQKSKFNELKESDDKIKRRNLLSMIKPFLSWQNSLPHNAESLLHKYVDDIDWQQVTINSYLSFNPEEERINNVDQCLGDIGKYLENREQQIESEKQRINYALTRLQAVRIFDGMLKGYFSAIKFAKWENTRP